MSAAPRLPGIDALKGLACVMIVWHHLAFYGPMSDVVHPFAPALMGWLYDYGRMAVQVFLVVGGFLGAASLAPKGVAVFDSPGRLLFRRYWRLAKPYLVALAVSVLVAALVRPWFAHPSVPAAPTLPQLLAHVFLLQDILGQEALSAGVWYVAIDFQLYAAAVLIFTFARRFQSQSGEHADGAVSAPLGVSLVLLLALASLLFFNRLPAFDITALYFCGSYALGMLAFWASSNMGGRRGFWLAAMAAMGALALALDFRGRLVVALVTAFGLVWLSSLQPNAWLLRCSQQRWLLQLGKVSYSVFLIHFPVCLLVNAIAGHFWPTQLLPNVAGLLLAFVLSLLAGSALYRWVESQPLLPVLGRLRRI
ncbi:Peptidoglycan/LPS O-acetylase OafA/YrhL, contains acyltransferase and SGNH-hydrolase domains [Polaromonas sp. YR568]|uniref:acyltransferase family protein n=1 Tax=Polaromonas sp. YR568 TaxID=1855301 RepID=UPI0008DF48F6|nr:acyltransferase [Polaromonas sp. YR568]SFU36156.1 Peptidoglycan/LPS O-acetylase OafA/YrhL, contains acyltransferase and SGNH-hydrolase domains [Polaromonas sp. YR568]